ncbi:glutamate-5-semialdehyde dehydrogenase [Niabella insulamsoli]|uniref:glutamate-5-semialdehyde dehydrogenase n=1 Tax=Niabella insulamsoli TaxID=3144874 RepID=UPI0031FBA5E9
MSIQNTLIKVNKSKIALQQLPERKLKQLLNEIARQMIQNEAAILKANEKDLSSKDANDPKNDRLMLNSARLKNISKAIKHIAKLPDPTQQVLAERVLANGLKLKKISVPLGVVGAIYESRPNVTYDIAALCLRSRNACVLKGSADAQHTNKVSIRIIQDVLKQFGLDANTVSLLPPQREVVQEMFTATKYLDVLIPRGSEGLINFVRQNSLVPVIETGAGVCHVYIEKNADLQKAVDIAVNAKVSRPSVCNSADAFIVDEAVAPAFLKAVSTELVKNDVEIFADKKAYTFLKGYPHLNKAKTSDFGREFLSLKCAVKVVKGIDEALAHIAQFSTKHSEAIVSKDKKACDRFIAEVDAAAVYTNASTRFTDGEEFGLGAEIGISTQKLHARGPFALEKLVTEKWVLQGNGQVR